MPSLETHQNEVTAKYSQERNVKENNRFQSRATEGTCHQREVIQNALLMPEHIKHTITILSVFLISLGLHACHLFCVPMCHVN